MLLLLHAVACCCMLLHAVACCCMLLHGWMDEWARPGEIIIVMNCTGGGRIIVSRSYVLSAKLSLFVREVHTAVPRNMT